jgi:hypothetical protein
MNSALLAPLILGFFKNADSRQDESQFIGGIAGTV